MLKVDIVNNFHKVRALVIGDAMLDSYLEGTASRLCSEGPVPVVTKSGEERVPGGAANTASNLRALGAQVMFLGFVGRDANAAYLRTALRRYDIDDGWLVEDPNISTIHKMRILADEQYVVRFDEGDTTNYSKSSREELLYKLEQALTKCDVIVVSDYSYGAVSEDVTSVIKDFRRTHDIPLMVDSKNIISYGKASATLITPNHHEARAAVGRPASIKPPDIEEMMGIGKQLLDCMDCRFIAITMASEGVLLLGQKAEPLHIPAYPIPKASVAGAGDSFLAATALSIAVGADIAEATRIGVENARLAVLKRRTAVVEHRELLLRMSTLDRQSDQPYESLIAELEAARREGKVIVMVNGVFDLLHAGHVNLLRKAKELGDLLVVAINSDKSARRLKGPNRPINDERHRLELVASLEPVDHVVLFDEDTPIQLIKTIRPHVLVKGADYEGQEIPEAPILQDIGTKLVLVPLTENYSTSSLIERIISSAPNQQLTSEVM